MAHTAASLAKLFDAGVPKTNNPQAYAQLEQLRDRLFSTAYRLVRDLPDSPHVTRMVTHLVQAQGQGNMAILDSFKQEKGS